MLSFLKARDRWIAYKLQWDQTADKFRKKPYCPTTPGNHEANANDPAIFHSYEIAEINRASFSGLGYAFTGNTEVIGIDIDLPANSHQCLEIIQKFKGTYCERSPSGNLRIFTLGQWPRAKTTHGKNFLRDVIPDRHL